MKKAGIIIIVFAFVVIAVFILMEIFSTQKTISENSKIIERLDKENDSAIREIKKTKARIKDMENNPDIMDRKILKNYRMLKKGQYIIDDSSD
ncbi:MAG: DUF948 domain-containing protein [bacterium]